MPADVRLAQSGRDGADAASVGGDVPPGAAGRRAGAEPGGDLRRRLRSVVERAADRDVEAAAGLRREAERILARFARLNEHVAEVLVAVRFAVAVHVDEAHDSFAVEHE